MKEILAALMVAFGNLMGDAAPSVPAPEPAPLPECKPPWCIPMDGQRHLRSFTLDEAIRNPSTTIAIGLCAGYDLTDATSGDILIGAYTSAPPGVKGFVNIGNVWCGLRETGERVDCPAPHRCGS